MRESRRPVRVGIQLPEVERVVRWPEYLAMARAAEDVGCDTLWLGDHLLYRYGDGSTRGPWEVWTACTGDPTTRRRAPGRSCAGPATAGGPVVGGRAASGRPWAALCGCRAGPGGARANRPRKTLRPTQGRRRRSRTGSGSTPR